MRSTRSALLAALLLSACASPTTADYLKKQEGYQVIRGHVTSMLGMHSPEVERLKNGTVFTVTTEGCTIEMYFDERDPRTHRRKQRTFELRPGDKFINGQPFAYVLIKQ